MYRSFATTVTIATCSIHSSLYIWGHEWGNDTRTAHLAQSVLQWLHSKNQQSPPQNLTGVPTPPFQVTCHLQFRVSSILQCFKLEPIHFFLYYWVIMWPVNTVETLNKCVLLPMVLIRPLSVLKSEFELWDKPVLCLYSSGIRQGWVVEGQGGPL